MNITLYKNTSDEITVPKSLTSVSSLEGKLVDDCDILNPSIRVNLTQSILLTNYAYIPSFARYYYITNIIIENNNIARIEMKVDVLNSFWDKIKNTAQHIVKNQNYYNMYLRDSQMVTTEKTKKQIKLFDEPEGKYIFNETPITNGHTFILNVM